MISTDGCETVPSLREPPPPGTISSVMLHLYITKESCLYTKSPHPVGKGHRRTSPTSPWSASQGPVPVESHDGDQKFTPPSSPSVSPAFWAILLGLNLHDRLFSLRNTPLSFLYLRGAHVTSFSLVPKYLLTGLCGTVRTSAKLNLDAGT
jgi:hypothetical protein